VPQNYATIIFKPSLAGHEFSRFHKMFVLEECCENVNPYSITIKAMVGKKQNWEDKKQCPLDEACEGQIYEYAFIRMRINSDNSGTSRTI